MKKVAVAAANHSMCEQASPSLRASDASTAIQKQDAFALLGLPCAFDIDQSVLHRAYIQQQQKFHPDRFARASDTEKLAAMQTSADANQAYTTLKDPLLRIEYLLGLQGIVLGDRPDAVKASQALLIESMEMREALFEVQTPDDIAKLRDKAQQQEQAALALIQSSFAADDGATCAQAAIRLRFLRKFAEEAKKRAMMVG
jgi:molecular chaperone HscB